MRYLAVLTVCLLLAGGCARTTYLPGHNLDGTSGPATHTLTLTTVERVARGDAVGGFLRQLSGRCGTLTVAYGASVLEEDVAAVEGALTARGVKARFIAREQVGADDSLRVIFAERKPFTKLDTYWFSNAAVSPEFGKATQYNFTAQMVHPEQVSQPDSLGESNPQGAVGPVERYQSGQVRELPENSMEVGGGSSSGSSSGD